MYCSTCGDDRLFEQPPCRDGHGPDCPERACTECGTAVLVGPPDIEVTVAPPASASSVTGRTAAERAVA